MTAGKLKTAADEAASGRSEEQARIERARRDRAGWFPGTHASGVSMFAILSRDGRQVARFDRPEDRDAVLVLIGLEVPAGRAVTALAFAAEGSQREGDQVAFEQEHGAKLALVAALNLLDRRKS